MSPIKKLDKQTVLELTTRRIRWGSIWVVALTFPYSSPQALYVYGLLLVAILFNATRYASWTARSPVLKSPIVPLIFDSAYVGALIFLAGNISTPYSGLLIFMIVTGAYLYQIIGTVVVASLAALMIGAAIMSSPFDSIVLSQGQLAVVTMFVLLTLGYYVQRLTHQEKVERETIEQLRLQSEQGRTRLLSLVDSLNDAIFVTNEAGEIIQCNKAATLLVGSSDNLAQQNIQDILPLYKRTDPNHELVDLLKDSTSTQRRRDLCLKQEDDKRIDLEIVVTAIYVGDTVSEYIIVCEDISQERSLDEQRSDFISVASHELRTPIAIIDAALTSVLQRSNSVPDDTRLVIEQAHRNSRQLADIVKDLTLLAEARNDNIPVRVARLNPNEIIKECTSDFKAQAQQRGIALKSHVHQNTPAIMSTEHHVKEILQNYINNALKYSSKGAVTVTAEPAKDKGVLFSVKDEGVGISASNQKLLFTKFFRAEDYRTRSTGGTGLGLYLCMELAKRLGAKVWCESALNKGSTFYLQVPPQSNLQRDQDEVVRAQVATLVDDI